MEEREGRKALVNRAINIAFVVMLLILIVCSAYGIGVKAGIAEGAASAICPEVKCYQGECEIGYECTELSKEKLCKKACAPSDFRHNWIYDECTCISSMTILNYTEVAVEKIKEERSLIK